MSDHRDTIFLEQAEVIAHHPYAGDQQLITLRAPNCAASAQPGQFVHLQTDPDIPLRRPISIMRANPDTGAVDLLYKVVGHGTQRLTQRQQGEKLSLLGPIGKPFVVSEERTRPLLIGGGVGMPPMFFLADRMRANSELSPLVLLGSEVPFPFAPKPSQFLLSGIPEGVIAAAPLLEDWGIASRLASLADFAGCFDGYVTELARQWLESLTDANRDKVALFACGPEPMLRATAKLAQAFELPCQLSLEEYMACGVGGCAGCTVQLETEQGPAMKRVCVDGPVFDAREVYPAGTS